MIYMLDTDTSSYLIRGMLNPSVVKRYRTIAEDTENRICVSVVTYAELMYGVNLKPSAAGRVEDFVNGAEIIPWDIQAALHYAGIRAHAKKAGKNQNLHDMQIAAHARSLGATIVTNNERHFRDVPGVLVENWAEEAA